MMVLYLRLAVSVIAVTLVIAQPRPFQCRSRQGREPNLLDDACATYYVCSNYTGQLRRCQDSQQFDFSDRTCRGDSEVWCNQQLRTFRRRQTTPSPNVNTTTVPANTTVPDTGAATTARGGLVDLLGALFPQVANTPAGVPGIVGLQGNAPGVVIGLNGNAGLVPGVFGQPDGGLLGDGVAGPFGLRGVVPQQSNQIPVFVNAQGANPYPGQFPVQAGVDGNGQNPGLTFQGAGGNGFGQLQPNNGNPQVNPIVPNGFNIIQIQPNQAFPAQPNQAFPAHPNQAFPAHPNQAFPAQPNQAFPAQPNQAFPAQRNQQTQPIPVNQGNGQTARMPGLQPNLREGQQNQSSISSLPVTGAAGQIGSPPPNNNHGLPGQTETRNNYTDRTRSDIIPDGPAEFFPKIFNISLSHANNETSQPLESDRSLPRAYSVDSSRVLNETNNTLDESGTPRELFRTGREARNSYLNVQGPTEYIPVHDLDDFLEKVLQNVLEDSARMVITAPRESRSESLPNLELLKININKLAGNLLSDYSKIKPLVTPGLVNHFQEALHRGRVDEAVHIFKYASGFAKKILASEKVKRNLTTEPTGADLEKRNSSSLVPNFRQSSTTRDIQFNNEKQVSLKTLDTPNKPSIIRRSKFRNYKTNDAGRGDSQKEMKQGLRSTSFWKPKRSKIGKHSRSKNLRLRYRIPRPNSNADRVDENANILQENNGISITSTGNHQGASVRLTVGNQYTLEVNDLLVPMKLRLDSKHLNLSVGQRQDEFHQRYRKHPEHAHTNEVKDQGPRSHVNSDLLHSNYVDRARYQWWYNPKYFNG